MKNKIILLFGSLLILSFSTTNCSRDGTKETTSDNSVTVSCDPELYKLVISWVNTYGSLNPEVNVEVINPERPVEPENQIKSGTLTFTISENNSLMSDKTPWKTVVGRDVIVMVINASNPFIHKIYDRGISPERLKQLITDNYPVNWRSILGEGLDAPAKLCMIDDPFINKGLTRYLELDHSDIGGMKFPDGEGLISAVRKDPFAIGICKIADVIDPVNQSFLTGISLLPIDKDGSGKIEYMENIYTDLKIFTRGIWIGKYPRDLIYNIYSLSEGQPSDKAELAFLKWIVSDGQVLLDNHGFSNLVKNERMAKARMIENYENPVTPGNKLTIPAETLLFKVIFPGIMVCIIVAILIRILAINISARRNKETPETSTVPRAILNPEFVESLPGLYYDKSHTWAFMEKDGLVKIGIDDFLQRITGPLTRVKLKQQGEKVKKGSKIFSIIQDGKQLDICAPLTGTIREQNKMLLTDSSVLNSSPYSDGWVYRIEPTNWLKEIQIFIMGKKYKEWLKSEFTRLKEFFIESLRPETVQFSHVLQDGGELMDNILAEFGPEVWEDFQTNFIDVSS